MQPLISIIIPMRNAMPYLIACLDSIVNQTYKNWELIVIDDHSKDNSVAILSQYIQQDTRINYYELEDGEGIIPALQLGLSRSKGQFITRMDADDLMSRIKIECLYSLLNDIGLGKVATSKVKYIKDGGIAEGYQKYEQWINNLMEQRNHWDHIYKECVIPSPCWLVSKDDLAKIGGFNSSEYPEDYDLCFRMKGANYTVTATQNMLHYWRDYENRTSRTDPNYQDNRFLQLKVKYFIKQDYNKESNLQLWGAGNKGKNIATLLTNKEIPFSWHTNNPKKIGKEIYGITIQSEEELVPTDSTQVIVSFANEAQQKQAKEILEGRLPSWRQHTFFFS